MGSWLEPSVFFIPSTNLVGNGIMGLRDSIKETVGYMSLGVRGLGADLRKRYQIGNVIDESRLQRRA